jgi:hypothetical protein
MRLLTDIDKTLAYLKPLMCRWQRERRHVTFGAKETPQSRESGKATLLPEAEIFEIILLLADYLCKSANM